MEGRGRGKGRGRVQKSGTGKGLGSRWKRKGEREEADPRKHSGYELAGRTIIAHWYSGGGNSGHCSETSTGVRRACKTGKSLLRPSKDFMTAAFTLQRRPTLLCNGVARRPSWLWMRSVRLNELARGELWDSA